MRKSTLINGIFFLVAVSLITYISCNTGEKKQGERLVKTYCSSCHLPVYAEELDSAAWTDGVLPAMAPRLGIRVGNKRDYIKPQQEGVGISYDDWMDLVDYFKKFAPKKLSPAEKPVPLRHDSSVFALKRPGADSTSSIATTSLVKIDSAKRRIITSDMNKKNLTVWNKDLTIVKEGRPFPSAPVNWSLTDGGDEIITTIGTLEATNLAYGQVLKRDPVTDSVFVVANGLRRPVQAAQGDFNRNGLTDLVICEFGHEEGGLTLLEQEETGKYKEKEISRMPGAEQVLVEDFNQDGWPDIMALFAQAREGIWLFINDKKGGFEKKKLLEFPPHYGSASFQWIDINGDGKKDIIYTCGDNADFSQVLKPFHGVYIYLNEGDFKFKKSYFYPINGCTKVVAADFDQDGDVDFATIAFFSDRKGDPSESFIYFEQDKPMHFIPHAVPISTHGRWISMDAGDYDGDGDLDLVLGNYSAGFNFLKVKRDWDTTTPFIVLENQTK